MDFRLKLFILVLAVISLEGLAIFWFNKEQRGYQSGLSQEADRAVNQALVLFRESKRNNMDLTGGPCLSDALIPGWVADIVHKPRSSVDNLPENQCPSYLRGSSKHFVEIDTEGAVIRVR